MKNSLWRTYKIYYQ